MRTTKRRNFRLPLVSCSGKLLFGTTTRRGLWLISWPDTFMFSCRLLAFLSLFVMLASQSARADCFDDAATFHRVNPIILRAIAIQESGNKPWAYNRNANGSIDYGLMEINSIHLPELAQYGMTTRDLFDGCKSIYTGAWILRKKIDKYGNTWAAVGAYHSETPALRDRYAEMVRAIAIRLAKEGYDSTN